MHSSEHFLVVRMLLCNYAKFLCDAPISRPKMGPIVHALISHHPNHPGHPGEAEDGHGRNGQPVLDAQASNIQTLLVENINLFFQVIIIMPLMGKAVLIKYFFCEACHNDKE